MIVDIIFLFNKSIQEYFNNSLKVYPKIIIKNIKITL
jgi:hypothetical protein